MSRKLKRKAFSLLEIIAAVIILAVVATATVGTVAPMREKSSAKLDESSVASLNALAQTYFLEIGTWPRTGRNGVADLLNRGYVKRRVDGGNFETLFAKFQFDATTKTFRPQ
jgi:prepilin-type N-terminal cleavage/methylation domain-containing protein